MGFTNYIIIEKYKLAIEVNRYTDIYVDYSVGNTDYPDTDIKITDITIDTISELVNYSKNVPILKGDDSLIVWLKNRNIDFDCIDEYNFSANTIKYKDYLVIRNE